MKTKRNFIHVLICSFIICFAILGCEGPEGPTGPQGEQGQQGLQGDQGPAGEDGNANVIYSDWMDVEWNVLNNPTVKAMDIDVPEITEDFLGTGVLLVYTFNSSTGLITALPRANNNYSVDFHADAGRLRVVATSLLDDEEEIDMSWMEQVRYVLIPGGLPAKIPSDFFDNYSAVKTYYGLPD